MEEIKCKHIAQLEGGFEMANRVYSPDGLCPTIRTMQGGGLEPKIVEEKRFFKQALETIDENDCKKGDTIDAFNKRVNSSGVSPTVTTRPEGFKTAILVVDDEPIVYDGYNQSVRKDSSTVGTLTRNCGADLKRSGQGIIETTKQYSRPHGFNKGGITESEIFPAVRCSSSEDGNNGIVEGIRVRKLTPKECWRLMGFDDESFDKAKKVVSNSQLYKQAGNSIVVDVLMAIFKNLF